MKYTLINIYVYSAMTGRILYWRETLFQINF